MTDIIEIETGTNPNGKLEAVFIAITSKAPASNYLQRKFNVPVGVETPIVLMLNRTSDGKIGMPGGKVDSGEDLITAAIREVEEEIGFVVADRSKLQPVCSHEFSIVTHLFQLDLPYQRFMNLYNEAAVNCVTNGEIMGIHMSYLGDFKKYGAKEDYVQNYLQHNLAPTVREELECLITKVQADNAARGKTVHMKLF